MSYGHLLKTQANDVLNAVRKTGLDPEDFAWDVGEKPTLLHTASRAHYFFRFERDEFGGHQAAYSPGEATVYETQRSMTLGDILLTWEGQLSTVERWLANLKREIQAPDLWSLLSEQTALVQAASADSPNTPFSAAEIGKISDGLRELQAYIEKTHHLDEQKHAFIESRLGYLVDAAHRQGRQDLATLGNRGFIHACDGLGDGTRSGKGDIPFRR